VRDGFLFNKPLERAPSGVVNRLAHPCPNQSDNAQCLQGDRLVLTDESESELVVMIQSCLTHLPVQHGNSMAGFFSIVGSFLFAA
jgi:hypothetical protein